MPRIRCDIAFRLQSQTRQVPPGPDSPGVRGCVFLFPFFFFSCPLFFGVSCFLSFFFGRQKGNPIRYVDGESRVSECHSFFFFPRHVTSGYQPRPFITATTTTGNMHGGKDKPSREEETQIQIQIQIQIQFFFFRHLISALLCAPLQLSSAHPTEGIAGCIPHSVYKFILSHGTHPAPHR